MFCFLTVHVGVSEYEIPSGNQSSKYHLEASGESCYSSQPILPVRSLIKGVPPQKLRCH